MGLRPVLFIGGYRVGSMDSIESPQLSSTSHSQIIRVVHICSLVRLSVTVFSIIADEVTDVSNKEQCSICIHYVLNNDVNETFISFVEV